MSRITDESIERVREADIVRVVESMGVKLKQKGKNHSACCPFHNEKTASFSVNAARGFYKCFGCGESGDVLSFVQAYGNKDFIESVEYVAGVCGIRLEYEEESEQERKARVSRKDLREVMRVASGWFKRGLVGVSGRASGSGAVDPLPLRVLPLKTGGELAKEYLYSRGYDDDVIAEWGLGWAANEWRALAGAMEGQTDACVKLGLLVKKDNGQVYDFYRGRVMFPICDVNGQVLGFGGRVVPFADYGDKQPPKYLNSPESPIYIKSRVLYGLDKAAKHIRATGVGILTEGYTDVISMHRAGNRNAVAVCGTSLTPEHVQLMKRHANEWWLMKDMDGAGKKAMLRDVPMVLQAGMKAMVVSLPEGADPDSWISSLDSYHGGKALKGEVQLVDGFRWYASTLLHQAGKDVIKHAQALEEILEMLSYVEVEFIRNAYVETLADVSREKKTLLEKLLKEKVKVAAKAMDSEEEEKWDYEWASEDEAMQHGFVERRDEKHVGYYFLGESKSLVQQTYYVLKPLYHIYSQNSADNRRLFEVYNGRQTMVVEIPSKSVMSQDQFGAELVSQGTFLPAGSYNKVHHLKLLNKLLPQMPTAYELKSLGWQAEEKFFAFCNMVYKPGSKGERGTLAKYDEYGMVQIGEVYFFSPSSSMSNSLVRKDENIYENDMYLCYKEPAISFEEWCGLVIQAYDRNGWMMIPYVIATLMRDLIIKTTKIAHLYAYGGVNAGKSEYGESVSNFFFSGKDSQGELYKPFNLNQGTEFSFFNRMERFKNCPNLLNEFDENAIDEIYFRAIKSAFDGEGRTKGLKEKNRSTTQKINCTIVFMGQFLGTKDENSVLMRSLPQAFKTVALADRPAAQVEAFTKLKQLEHKGLSGILPELLDTRWKYEAEFPVVFGKHLNRMQDELKAEGVSPQPRILKNFCCMSAIVEIAGGFFSLPFTSEHFYAYAKDSVRNMTSLVASTSGVSEFWSMVEYLYDRGEIKQGEDFVVEEGVKHLNVNPDSKTSEPKSFTPPKNLLFIRISGVHKLYMENYRKGTGRTALNEQTLLLYMKDQSYYVGWMKAKKFKGKTSSCYVFAYDDLGVTLQKDSAEDAVETVVRGEVMSKVENTPLEGKWKFMVKEIATLNNHILYECYTSDAHAFMEVQQGRKILMRGMLSVVPGPYDRDKRILDVIDYECVKMGEAFAQSLQAPPRPAGAPPPEGGEFLEDLPF